IEFIKMGKTQSSHLLPANISSTLLRVIRGINTKFGVEAVLLNHKGLKRVEFIGEADRAIFAAFAFDIIYRELNEHTGQFRNSFAGSGTGTLEVTRRVNSYVSGWVEGALEKLPVITPDDESNNKINNYIDKEFQNIDRETFKQQLREAMKNLTADYEVGLKKGRKLSVNRPVGGTQAVKKITKS
ncbi:transcriptional regulator, partial [Vibrio sp. 10N.222.46.A1]